MFVLNEVDGETGVILHLELTVRVSLGSIYLVRSINYPKSSPFGAPNFTQEVATPHRTPFLERRGLIGRITAAGITIRSSWQVSASNGKLSAF